MSTLFSRNFIRFTTLSLIQVFLLQNVGYYNLSTPYLYILFVLLLPIKTSNWLVFTLAFISGFTIDAFYDTFGLHTTACVILAFVRIIFISLTIQQEKYEAGQPPSLAVMGFRWFFVYVTVLTIIHHSVLFLFETFRFSDFAYTLLRIILSSLFTIILIFTYEYIFYYKKVR